MRYCFILSVIGQCCNANMTALVPLVPNQEMKNNYMLSYASNRGEERSRMMITVLHKLKENVVIVVKPGIFKVNLTFSL